MRGTLTVDLGVRQLYEMGEVIVEARLEEVEVTVVRDEKKASKEEVEAWVERDDLRI